MADNNDTPPGGPPPKKRGRPPGKKNFKPSVPDDGRRNYSLSVSTVFRERVDPNLIYEFYWAIVQNKNPYFEQDPVTGGWRVQEDTSPNASPPSLGQRVEAMKEITNRRDGLAPQFVNIDAMLKGSVQAELPPELLAALSPHQFKLLEMALLPAPSEPVEDAEYVMQNSELGELQESGQVPEGTSGELQESGQVPEGTKSE